MSRHGRRSGSSASTREDDLRVSDLINEFRSLEEHELKSFFATLVNNQDIQACIFRIVGRDRSELTSEARETEIETLKGICSMLLAFYRNLVNQASKTTILLASTANDLAKSRPVVMQYLPHLTSVYLWSHHSPDFDEKRSMKFLEAFFLAIYNSESLDTQHAAQQQQQTSSMSSRVPGLSQSSIFHESDRLDAESIEKLNRRTGGGGAAPTLMEPVFKPVQRINASNRCPVIQLLWRGFVRHLPDISKYGIEQVCRSTIHILSSSGSRRVFVAAPIMTEMLHLSYFCIYNGFQVQGSQILDLIDERAAANAWPSVLMVASSIKRLSVSCGSSQSQLNVTSTPGQLAKHMITNASFRTKKISDDIPKVFADDEGNNGANLATPSTVRMKSIVEDAEDELTSPPSSGKPAKFSSNNNGGEMGKQHTSNKEKLMAKLPNSLKVTMTGGKKERTHSETNNDRESSTDKEEKKSGNKLNVDKLVKSEKKKSGKLQVSSTLSPATNMAVSSGSVGGGGSPSPTSLNSGSAFARSQNGDGVSVNSKTIESIEQVEELIQMKKLPPETISIHSPESGTTLF